MTKHAVLALLVGLALLLAAAAGGEEQESSAISYADARKGFKTQLTRSGPAPQPGEALVAPRGAVAVKYGKDPQLTAFVTAPRELESGKHPVVIFLHGGFAWGRDDWAMTRPYRAAGFITVMPVLRGENGLAGAFSFFYDEVDDVVAAIELATTLPSADPSRIFLAGHSAGGTLALLTSQVSPRVRATASFSGSPNQFEFIPQYAEITPFDATDLQELRMRSPSQFPGSFLAPVRAYFGRDEAWFARTTGELVKEARAAGADVSGVAVAGDHFSALPEAIRLSIAFFASHAPR